MDSGLRLTIPAEFIGIIREAFVLYALVYGGFDPDAQRLVDSMTNPENVISVSPRTSVNRHPVGRVAFQDAPPPMLPVVPEATLAAPPEGDREGEIRSGIAPGKLAPRFELGQLPVDRLQAEEIGEEPGPSHSDDSHWVYGSVLQLRGLRGDVF
ncbi:uncharacterized protein FIBRA_08606 [Fibroporia radiculosa]|uniref:Uncharacterized protein n=1 Tax=Fibroporia radiculosa TaxID=599839 RepID=J4H595_9APHY|nr:uncharacterized protein FIBRA_08606 [Fibroporia radiculosa]CCM06349.1 predicted protein [Fibroporia radiculosa]